MSKAKVVIINILNAIMTLLTICLVFFFMVALTVNSVYIKTQVRGYSMQPTLNADAPSQGEEWDYVYINQIRSFKINDILVAKVEWFSYSIIKRLVGCPGDKIEIRDLGSVYGLYVNGEQLYTKEKTDVTAHNLAGGTNQYYQKYLDFINLNNEENFPNNVGTTSEGNKCIVLNAGEYFLMGDNWGETTDCLSHGPIKKSQIIGKVDLIVKHNQDSNKEFIIYLLKSIFN